MEKKTGQRQSERAQYKKKRRSNESSLPARSVRKLSAVSTVMCLRLVSFGRNSLIL